MRLLENPAQQIKVQTTSEEKASRQVVEQNDGHTNESLDSKILIWTRACRQPHIT